MKSENDFTVEQLHELVSRLSSIPGINLSPDSDARIPLSVLANSNALEQFLKAIAWTIEEIKAIQRNTKNHLSPQD
jgi:hypothetical protein